MYFGGFGELFPYTNFHDMNMDWILQVIKEISEKIDNITVNKITIADPLNWDITKQYQAYTVVMDNGNAYLSMKPVPYGVDIANEEYWQEIFNLEQIFTSLKDAVTYSDDGQSTVTSQNRTAGDLVWLNDTLKIITNDMTIGDQYTDQNCEDISLEGIIYSLKTALDDIDADMTKLVKNRIYGKTIAIYGDSWVTDNWSAPWMGRLATLAHTPEAIHHVGLGSAGMGQVYTNCWDNYVADIYIVMAGLNDVGLNTGGDIFMTNLQTFAQALHTANPNAEVYFVTPPKIDRNDFLRKRFPAEFYRTSIWRLANKNKYHVINGLKWVDIAFIDGVHPTTNSAPIIADYLFESLINFGDEETHTKEYSSMGRNTNDILFTMDGGLCFLEFNNTQFTPIAVDGSSGIVLNIGMELSQNQTVVYGKGNGSDTKNQPCMLVVGQFANQTQAVILCPPLVGTGASSFTISYPARVRTAIGAWNINVTA